MLGLGGLISQVWEDGRALVHAEVRLLKSKAFAIIRRSRAAIILVLIAGCFALASVMALMLGLVLALAPLVGAALAGVILMAGGLVLAGLLVWIAIRLIAGPPPKPEVETPA
ncbi:phage holin family protein [Sphingomonas abietis]|uniref:Phage holin family protein n=1 Tax=Sphingomonas abietis TaxID=3012344 RepID=A0ABY7NIW0_9SPHN|nr:phage holin family protein [Sphingomonas abietis]WBO21258.1 phage holin family protein [Sphingomonas abietis]